MKAYRTTLIPILALVIGFALAETLRGCPHKDNYVMLPTTIKPGDTLTWKGQDPKNGKLTLTIPEGLCVATPGTYNGEFHVYVVDVQPGGLECTVKNPPSGSTPPIPWFYKYQFGAAQGDSPSPALMAPQLNIQLSPIVGSCYGCGNSQADKFKKLTAGGVTLQEYVVLDGSTPTVVDQNGVPVPQTVDVPSTTTAVSWMPQGPGLVITFQSSPCSDGVLVLSGTNPTCTISPTVSAGDYSYTVVLQGSSPSRAYTLNVAGTR
jgi:hypothetical protein